VPAAAAYDSNGGGCQTRPVRHRRPGEAVEAGRGRWCGTSSVVVVEKACRWRPAATARDLQASMWAGPPGGGVTRETNENWCWFKTWNEKRIDPVCIRHLTDEYRWVIPINLAPPYIHRFGHVTDEYMPHIFVGDVTEPTNIWGSQSQIGRFIYSSVSGLNR
jgi:hypothetical protein